MEPLDPTLPNTDTAVDPINGNINWFTKTGIDNTNDQLLRPAEDAVHGRDGFRQKMRGLLKGTSDLQAAKTKEELEQQITNYQQDDDSLEDRAAAAMNGATQSHDKYETNRKSGGKKVGRRAQLFVKRFADFMQCYSGVIEVLKGAGQMYGIVAYETLSIFLVVVINKGGNDSKIAELLGDLRKSFPQLSDWKKIYPTVSIKTLVAEVYKQVIDFARDASLYFTHFSTRLWRAIGRPPSMGIDNTVGAIRGKLAAVNAEAMIQLHKRTKNIDVTVQESHREIKKLKDLNDVLVASYKHLQEDYQAFREEVIERERLEDIQRLELFKDTLKVGRDAFVRIGSIRKEVNSFSLQISYPSPETDITACNEILNRAFRNTSHSPKSPRIAYVQMSLDLLNTCDEYLRWHNLSQSCLLVLSGRTASDGRSSHGYTNSWLSPATVQVTEQGMKEGRKVAYYFCHPDIRAEAHRAKDVLQSLLYQILEWKPDVLRHKNQAFLSSVRSEAWRKPASDKEAINTVLQLLREVLMELKDVGVITIVIDRLDLCEEKLFLVMDALVGFIANLMDESCVVKMMVVLDPAHGYWDAENLEGKNAERVMLRQDWNQRQLSPLEMQRKIRSY
ncbi:hypothetical protein MMC17_008711 [Xylographa soralifera]|nr:hypothetical protein [Xylographa soralifera]